VGAAGSSISAVPSGSRGEAPWVVLLLVALLGAPVLLEAQAGPPLAVQSRQDLSFGELLGGLGSTIAPHDPVRSGQLRIRGSAGQSLELQFDLPDALERGAGGSIPLHFEAGDAHFSASGGTGDRIPFDPGTPWTVTLSSQGWSWVFLGGTALPPAQAPIGSYTGTITLTISDLGS
jgi:hypothetical protein